MLKRWTRLMKAIIFTALAAVLAIPLAIIGGLGVAGKEIHDEIRAPAPVVSPSTVCERVPGTLSVHCHDNAPCEWYDALDRCRFGTPSNPTDGLPQEYANLDEWQNDRCAQGYGDCDADNPETIP